MSSTEETTEAAELRRTVAELAERVRTLEAASAIRTLHHKYGYYLDKCLYQEVVDLFSDDGEVVFAGGVYQGRAGVERLYLHRFRERFTHGHNGPLRGFLLEHIMMQDVVTVSPDGRTACARIRALMQAGIHESAPELRGRTSFEQWWEGGLYENRYVLDDGVWKIKRLGYFPFWHAEYTKGWAHTPPLNAMIATRTYPDDPLGPDELVEGFEFFPATDVVPFHYPHPVTGKRS
ncbi:MULTISPECIES: nuclear transport factor 2 family protein [Amycolatopsis]|uniref:Carotenoid cleavage dioxygenase n=2 Tax=Amycolatopsis TaxID=1813 RepID=A0A1I4ATN5_9PSEU|nr:nuclear transport factor 2 family protein [Amycolatopsis sacchari]SFK59774.1 carotenoid cleavage dioxygenase [Amycolatopsis sacchari]